MLRDFAEVNCPNAKILRLKETASSAQDARRLSGASGESFLKSRLFLDENGAGILCVFQLNRKVDLDRVSGALGGKKIREAESAETIEVTGYSSELLPPLSVYGVKTLVDFPVWEKQGEVFCCTGESDSVLKIPVKELVECAENAEPAEITMP